MATEEKAGLNHEAFGPSAHPSPKSGSFIAARIDAAERVLREARVIKRDGQLNTGRMKIDVMLPKGLMAMPVA